MLVGLTQRVDVVAGRNERRDALDQRWHRWLARCGLTAVALPNHPASAMDLCLRLNLRGLVLTGGNDLASLGGDAPERDATEAALVTAMSAHKLPILGICRGMQFLAHLAGGHLVRTEGHAASRHPVETPAGDIRVVNSFHNWAVVGDVPDYEVTAWSGEGNVEAMRHKTQAVLAMMWHPEREEDGAPVDVEMVRRHFFPTAAPL